LVCLKSEKLQWQKKDKRSNNYLQNTTQKLPSVNSGAPGVSSTCYNSDTRHATLVPNVMISHELGKARYCDYDKQNIYVVICGDTDIPQGKPVSH